MANNRQKREAKRTGISLEETIFNVGKAMSKRRFPHLSVKPFSAYVADLIRRDVEEEMRRIRPGSNQADAVPLFLEFIAQESRRPAVSPPAKASTREPSSPVSTDSRKGKGSKSKKAPFAKG